jgi:hypothetical protein
MIVGAMVCDLRFVKLEVVVGLELESHIHAHRK